jgi:hypothetical protein
MSMRVYDCSSDGLCAAVCTDSYHFSLLIGFASDPVSLSHSCRALYLAHLHSGNTSLYTTCSLVSFIRSAMEFHRAFEDQCSVKAYLE